MKKKVAIGLFISAFILFSMNGEFRNATGDTVDFGWFSLVPPVVSIILAFISKDVIISLFFGIFAGGFILHLADGSIFYAIVQSFLSIVDYTLYSLADPWNAGIILQVLTIGGLIALMTKMGGAKAIANALSKKAKGPVSAQIITWILGILLFFDDYANSLIVGPVMRPVTDEKKVSREKLSFIVDATAAPIAGIALISTWVGYEVGLIKDGYEAIGQEVNAYSIFVETIPYRFYNILMLLFVLATVVFLREFGPMLTAERRARKYDQTNEAEINPNTSNELDEMEPAEGIHLSIWNAIIPISTLVVVAIVGFYVNGYQAILTGEDTALINS
ncbi:MAG: Na+/H+ antiporter NhaC family protein, partial [Carnobacterium alterfunditum]